MKKRVVERIVDVALSLLAGFAVGYSFCVWRNGYDDYYDDDYGDDDFDDFDDEDEEASQEGGA